MVQGRRFSTHYIFQSNLGINKNFEHFRLKGIVVKVIILINFFLVTGSLTAQKSINKGYPIQPVPFSQVKITDRFWAPRIEINRKVTLPYAFKKCEETERIDHFAIAAGLKQGIFRGNRYDDSDVFKVIEGASYSLQQFYDPKLDAYLDSLIILISGAQEEDGYLYTSRTIDPQNPVPRSGDQRWSLVSLSHELYNAGHLYEAAVAHYMTTKKKSLLDIAIKNANLICNLFGPGKLLLVPGHEEIEIGLVRLYNLTSDKKYLETARFFIDERGNIIGHKLYGEYSQDDVPVIEQSRAVGHAVRAGYLYCGIADVAAMTGNDDYLSAIDRIWLDVVGTKLYLTGGIGVRGEDEALGKCYELPNEKAYCETCASIANAMWNYRMFLLHGESKYIDVFEKILYNGFLSGISLGGAEFFYANPLECRDSFPRESWYKVSCCPTNIVRFLPALPGYIYAEKENSLYVNLFISNVTSLVIDNHEIIIKEETDYPWDGKVKLTLQTSGDVNLKIFIRIPGWARNVALPSDLYTFSDNKTIRNVTIRINGKKTDFEIQNGFAIVDQSWRSGDEILIDIPMDVRRIVANKLIQTDLGYEAYQRGPIIYCFEGIDNNGDAINIAVTDKNHVEYSYNPLLLNGIGILHFMGEQINKRVAQSGILTKTNLTAIPYYAWAHRGTGSMAVWIPERISNK